MAGHLACLAIAAIVTAAEAPAAPLTSSVCLEPAVTDLRVVNDRWPDPFDLKQFGLDAIRIEGAKTEEDKYLAVWRWMRRCTMKTDGRAPSEGGRFVDSMKILNVYGAEQCGGLSLLVTDLWRALGYPASRLYRHGHTMADCWYVDADGVGRYHLTDNNYGWFVFSRDGGHIVTAEEIGADFSLYDRPSRTHVPWIDKKMWMWGWCHMVQLALPPARTWALHPGETAERLWGNVGAACYDHIEHRDWDQKDQPPYERKIGNGVFTFAANFGADWRGQLAAEPVNAAVKDGRLVQADPAKPAEVVYRVVAPYITADGEVTLASSGGRVDLETDRGTGWAPLKPGMPFKAQAPGGPVGRYGFLLRLRLAEGASVSAFAVRTVVQLNSLALPSLLAGENRVTVSGRLAKGQALEVTYVWDDVDGKGRRHVARAAALPYTYTILAAGKGWPDVTCRSVTVRAVGDDGQGNRVVADVPKPSVVPAGPLPSADVRTVIGPKAAPPMKSAAEFVKDLASDSADVRILAAQGLTILRDKSAWDPLVKVAYEDTTVAKICAVQALFWTDREKAVPVLRAILTKDPAVRFAEPRDDEQATFSNTAGTIAAMCGLTRFNGLVPELCGVSDQVGTECRWGVIRALGRINDPRAVPLIRRYVQSGNDDTATTANGWAGLVGDKESVPFLAKWLASKRYPIRTLEAIKSLGLLGAEGYTEQILEHLRLHPYSENWRAGCAEALGRVGDPAKSIPVLEKMLADEQWPWVREKIDAALKALKARAGRAPLDT